MDPYGQPPEGADRPEPGRFSHRGDAPRGTETILVLDDEPLVQRINAIELSRLGYDVHCADSGEEAVHFLREHAVDLIILDLVMPGMNGVETYAAIKAFKPEQRALVYSGYAPPEVVEAIKELGAEPILLKPTPLFEIATAIRKKLDAPN